MLLHRLFDPLGSLQKRNAHPKSSYLILYSIQRASNARYFHVLMPLYLYVYSLSIYRLTVRLSKTPAVNRMTLSTP